MGVDDYPPEQEEPDLVAAVDQKIELHRQVARIVVAYHDGLIEEGCKQRLAADLTVDFQHEVFENERGSRE